jgi:hypothetical protein
MMDLWKKQIQAADEVTDKYKILPTKILNGINIEFPDDVMKLGTLEARYVTGQIKISEISDFLVLYKEKTVKYQKEYADFRAANPIQITKALK